MTGILYFSSTGNSLYIAKRIKEKLGGSIKFIPDYEGNGNEFDRIIIVTPIYSFGLPAHVYDLLPCLDCNKQLIIILNYGGMVGGADYFAYEYCKKFGLNIQSVYTLKMPENFTLTFTVPQFYLKSVLKSADKRINNVIFSITNGKSCVPKRKKTKERIYLKNKSNWHLIGERFTVSDNCISCGKCVSICPSKNISFTGGNIVFSNKCVACLGCYHRCPQKAIKYLNKRKRFRYVNPNVEENAIGKDEE